MASSALGLHGNFCVAGRGEATVRRQKGAVQPRIDSTQCNAYVRDTEQLWPPAQPPALDDANFPVLMMPLKPAAANGTTHNGAAHNGNGHSAAHNGNGHSAAHSGNGLADACEPAADSDGGSTDGGSLSAPAPATPTRHGPGSLAAAAAAAGIVTSRSASPFPDFAGALRSSTAAATNAGDGDGVPPPGLKRAPSAGSSGPRPPATGVGAPRPPGDGHGLAAVLANGLAGEDGGEQGAKGQGRAEVAWVATGKAVAAEYADARTDARDHMRLRNQCFMQARGPPAVAQQLAGRA